MISLETNEALRVADFLLRGLDPDLKRFLEARARLHDRSLTAEIRLILEDAARHSNEEFLELVKRWNAEDDWPALGDPSALVRDDRDR